MVAAATLTVRQRCCAPCIGRAQSATHHPEHLTTNAAVALLMQTLMEVVVVEVAADGAATMMDMVHRVVLRVDPAPAATVHTAEISGPWCRALRD